QENQTPPSNVRSRDCRSGQKLIDGGSRRIQRRCSRSCNLRCRNLGRRNSVPHVHSRTLLRPQCAIFSTKDTKLKRKLRCAAGEADARLVAARCLLRTCSPPPDKCSSP